MFWSKVVRFLRITLHKHRYSNVFQGHTYLFSMASTMEFQKILVHYTLSVYLDFLNIYIFTYLLHYSTVNTYFMSHNII